MASSTLGGDDVEVVARHHNVSGGNDAPPQLELTLSTSHGARNVIESRALAYVSFAGGVAVIDSERRLITIAEDGARRVLAAEAGAPPVRGHLDELVYVAQRELEAEVRVLEATGRDRVVASGLASAGLLLPQADGAIFFVGAKNGGVAGLWRVSSAARCLTNCDLKTGEPWGDRFVPPPGDAAAIEVGAASVSWQAYDGKRYTVPLEGRK